MTDIGSITDLICNIKEVMKAYFYTKDESNQNYAEKQHTHTIDDELSLNSANPVENRTITNELNNKADEEHEHVIADIDTLSTKLEGKSNVGHVHTEYYASSVVDGLLSAKANSSHTHDDRYFKQQDVTDNISYAIDHHNHDSSYYTKNDITLLLSEKADRTHNHDSTYAKQADYSNLNQRFYHSNAVRVRLIRADSNSNPISQDTELKNEGTELVVLNGYKIAAKLYSIDSNLILEDRSVTLIFISSNGYPTVNSTTTDKYGVTRGMITLSNNLNGVAFAILKGTDDYYKEIDVKYVRYE